jgi:hypothetical protein
VSLGSFFLAEMMNGLIWGWCIAGTGHTANLSVAHVLSCDLLCSYPAICLT